MDDDLPAAGELALPIEESFASLYEEAPCGYLTTLLDGTIVRINSTLLKWTRYERVQLLRERKFHSLLTVGGQVFYETHFAPLLKMQGSVSELALDIVRADRSIFPALLNAKLHRDEHGRELVRIMVFDATDRRSYERELLSARREAEGAARVKADFVAMLSHDLRTPLTAICRIPDLLEQSGLTLDQAKYVRLLRSGCENVLQLLETVLTSSKLESGRMTLDTGVFDLPELIRDLGERLRLKAEEKRLELWYTIDERIPGALIGDAVKLSQVLTNLLGNSIKFTHSGWVGITATLVEPIHAVAQIELTVIDTGIGIDPDQLPAVFDEYTQVHDRTARDYGGAGLGLAITKKLVELHGGGIVAENRQAGGSLFRLTLPLQVPRQP